jgi:hypothetical protein
MTDHRSAKPAFSASASMSAREIAIRTRAEKAIERLSARHEAGEARLVATRFQKLLLSDNAQPALRPGWASEDRQTWLMRAAKYQIAREHQARLQTVRESAERMIAGKDKAKPREDRGR